MPSKQKQKPAAVCNLDKAIKLAFLFRYNLLPNYDNFSFKYESPYSTQIKYVKSDEVENNKNLILLCILAYIHPCKTTEDIPKIKRLIQSLSSLNLSDYLNKLQVNSLTNIFCELFQIQECDQVKGGVKQSINTFYTTYIENINLNDNSDFIQYKEYIESDDGSIPDPEGKKAYLNKHYQAQMEFMTNKEEVLRAMDTQIKQIIGNIKAIGNLLAEQQQPTGAGVSPTGYLSQAEIQSAEEQLARYNIELGKLTQQKEALNVQLQKYAETMNQIYKFDQQLAEILTTLQQQPSTSPGGAGGPGGPKAGLGAGAGGVGVFNHEGGSKRKRSESSTRRTTTVKKSSLKRIYKNKK